LSKASGWKEITGSDHGVIEAVQVQISDQKSNEGTEKGLS
jgi:hypothetical protein